MHLVEWVSRGVIYTPGDEALNHGFCLGMLYEYLLRQSYEAGKPKVRSVLLNIDRMLGQIVLSCIRMLTDKLCVHAVVKAPPASAVWVGRV